MPDPAQPLATPEWRAALAARPQWRSAFYLRLLHHIHWPRMDDIRDRRLARMSLGKRIAACAERGKVLVIESGRDCDGVEYSGKLHTIDATLAAFDWLDAQLGDWADGPYNLAVARPSEARHFRYTSRDLVLEAVENGHPHVIRSRYS